MEIDKAASTTGRSLGGASVSAAAAMRAGCSSIGRGGSFGARGFDAGSCRARSSGFLRWCFFFETASTTGDASLCRGVSARMDELRDEDIVGQGTEPTDATGGTMSSSPSGGGSRL